MKILRNPFLWITVLVMLTVAALGQDFAPEAPAGNVVSGLEGWVIQFCIKYTWAAATLMFLGTLRVVIKPLMTFLRFAAAQTATDKDDRVVAAVERSWFYTAILFVLDWLTSIKLPAAKAKSAAPARRGPWLLLFAGLLAALCLGVTGCGAVKPHGTVDTAYSADGTVTVATGLDIGTNVTVVGSGGYNVATGNWTAGISIVFKDELAAASAAAELAKYNLGPAPYTRTGVEWRIAQFDGKNPAHVTCIEIALKNGATLKGI